LIDDQHVVPAKALAAGFRFEHPEFAAWVEAAFPMLVS
jgi:NAD dependent epimerase/dehydratase family enzyme